LRATTSRRAASQTRLRVDEHTIEIEHDGKRHGNRFGLAFLGVRRVAVRDLIELYVPEKSASPNSGVERPGPNSGVEVPHWAEIGPRASAAFKVVR
jgi:hypothetical protein